MTSVIFGRRVFISADVPRMTLSESVPVTPEFRAETNAWMLNFFGTTNLLPDGEVILNQLDQAWHMNPRTYAGLMYHINKTGAAA